MPSRLRSTKVKKVEKVSRSYLKRLSVDLKGTRKKDKWRFGDLKKDIQRELDQTDWDWPGGDEGVPIHRTQFSLTPLLRQQTQELGAQYGCHTCCSHIALDSNQPWIGDHIPPTQLRPAAKRRLGCDDQPTVLLPQCDLCASKQAALVKALNSNPQRILTDDEEKLIVGDSALNRATHSIPATGRRVTANQGLRIQGLGVRNGCHSCGTTAPRYIYHADHVVPQEFATTYMQSLFKALGIPYPTDEEFMLRPQCPRCSGEQGGNLSSISKRAIALAKALELTVYK